MRYTNPGPAVTTGSIDIGLGGPQTVGTDAESYIAFYGVDPIQQPADAAQAALTLTTALSSGFGFTSATAFNAFTAQLENIRASLVLLGLLKGSA
jgi:hypothetical protein